MTAFMEIQHYFIAIVAGLPLLISLLNSRSVLILGKSGIQTNNRPIPQMVSILVPARNEEDNIGACLQALTEQNYASLEILVLDDCSSDRTRNITEDFIRIDPRIRLIPGQELPLGWIGKNWACHQLSREAIGDFLLFIDADTILHQNAVSVAIIDSIHWETDLLTVMPRRVPACPAESLMFPFIDWASFCWLPIKAAQNQQNPYMSATFGQFMLFRNDAYCKIGGYQAISTHPVDDFELGRMTKRNGLKWMLFEGVNWVQVRPYKGNLEAIKAVSRSIFPTIDYHVSILILLSVVVLGLAFLPILSLTMAILSYPHGKPSLLLATALIIMIAIPWLIVCRRFKHNTLIVPLYPLSMGLMLIVAFHSLITYRMGVTKWKGRQIKGGDTRF